MFSNASFTDNALPPHHDKNEDFGVQSPLHSANEDISSPEPLYCSNTDQNQHGLTPLTVQWTNYNAQHFISLPKYQLRYDDFVETILFLLVIFSLVTPAIVLFIFTLMMI